MSGANEVGANVGLEGTRRRAPALCRFQMSELLTREQPSMHLRLTSASSKTRQLSAHQTLIRQKIHKNASLPDRALMNSVRISLFN